MTTNAGKVFYDYFKKSRTSLLILSVLYLIGISAGAWVMRNMDIGQTTQIYELFENYLSLLGGDAPAFHQILYSCFFSGFRYFTIIVVLGFLIVGIPVLIAGLLYKGFCTGFALACLLTVYGLDSPIHLWVQILWQNLLLMPCVLLFCCQSLAFSSKMIQAVKRDKRTIAFDFRRESVLFILQYLGFLLVLAVLSFIGAGICTIIA